MGLPSNFSSSSIFIQSDLHPPQVILQVLFVLASWSNLHHDPSLPSLSPHSSRTPSSCASCWPTLPHLHSLHPVSSPIGFFISNDLLKLNCNPRPRAPAPAPRESITNSVS